MHHHVCDASFLFWLNNMAFFRTSLFLAKKRRVCFDAHQITFDCPLCHLCLLQQIANYRVQYNEYYSFILIAIITCCSFVPSSEIFWWFRLTCTSNYIKVVLVKTWIYIFITQVNNISAYVSFVKTIHAFHTAAYY